MSDFQPVQKKLRPFASDDIQRIRVEMATDFVVDFYVLPNLMPNVGYISEAGCEAIKRTHIPKGTNKILSEIWSPHTPRHNHELSRQDEFTCPTLHGRRSKLAAIDEKTLYIQRHKRHLARKLKKQKKKQEEALNAGRSLSPAQVEEARGPQEPPGPGPYGQLPPTDDALYDDPAFQEEEGRGYDGYE